MLNAEYHCDCKTRPSDCGDFEYCLNCGKQLCHIHILILTLKGRILDEITYINTRGQKKYLNRKDKHFKHEIYSLQIVDINAVMNMMEKMHEVCVT